MKVINYSRKNVISLKTPLRNKLIDCSQNSYIHKKVAQRKDDKIKQNTRKLQRNK